MEKQILDKDIKTFYVEASSFPNGVMAAHRQLQSLLVNPQERIFYGISFGGPGGIIIYRAAVEESYDGEAEKLRCATFLIKKGIYLSETMKDWKRDELSIGKTFRKLLADPHLDPDGYCVEIYLNERDVQCMVKIND